MKATHRVGIILISILLTACAPAMSDIPSPEPEVSPTPTIAFTSTPTPAPTAIVIPSPTLPPYAGFLISSPLEDIRLDELSSILSTSYQPPSPGWDDGHHGVDFAYWSRGSHEKMEGLGVFALMAGTVAGITNDRKPYGNQIIIETPLSKIPPELLAQWQPVQMATPYPINPRIPACESIQSQVWEIQPDSVYTLYGHLLHPVEFQIGDRVEAGQQIGQVGTTGASVNPHLHLEMRWGPHGTKFASMGFYDTSITDSERENYCLWRVSGQFILLNPMDVVNTWLHQQPPGS